MQLLSWMIHAVSSHHGSIDRVHCRFSVAAAAGPDGWALPANYPELGNGQILRLDWFILFLQFVTAVIVSIVASLGAIPQVCRELAKPCIP